MKAFETSWAAQDDVAVVSVAGEVDIDTVAGLQAVLDECIPATNGPLVLDLMATDFMDSSALKLVLRTRARLERETRRFVVACDTPVVLTVFHVSGLMNAMYVQSDLADAVGLARGGD